MGIYLKCVLFCLVVTLGTTAYGAFPTIESLFKNGNNKELTGDTIVVKMSIRQIENEQLLAEKTVGEEQPLKSPLEPPKKVDALYLKFIFSLNEQSKQIQLLLVEYKDSGMKSNHVTDVTYVNNILNKIMTTGPKGRYLFYALMLVHGLNDSRLISGFLQKYNQDYVANSVLLNQDKISLLNKYKVYLSAVKEDEKLAEEQVSPLKPEDGEKLAKVKEVLKEHMYSKNTKVRLKNFAGEFFWEVALENTVALFTNNEHRIKSMTVADKAGKIHAEFDDYVLFDGIHELPKFINLNFYDKSMYLLQMLSLTHFDSKKKTLVERYREYLKTLAENKKNNLEIRTESFNPPLFYPHFVLK